MRNARLWWLGSTDTLDNADNDSRFVHTYTNAGVYDVHLTCSTNGQGDGGVTIMHTTINKLLCRNRSGAVPTQRQHTNPNAWSMDKAARFCCSYPAPLLQVLYQPEHCLRCDRYCIMLSIKSNNLACFSSGEAGAVVVKAPQRISAQSSQKGWLRKMGVTPLIHSWHQAHSLNMSRHAKTTKLLQHWRLIN